MGAIVLNQGNIAEMKQGRKDFNSDDAFVFECFNRKGSFLLTLNNYLAQRDKEQYSQSMNG